MLVRFYREQERPETYGKACFQDLSSGRHLVAREQGGFA